jgi:cytoskeletal protein CcmA (bactofilin family)
MPKSDKPGMIDGFMSVQAVRHQDGRKPDGKPPDDKSPPNAKEEPQSRSAQLAEKASIGRTALPSRHELVCYSCGYAFVVTGKLSKVFCSKCREELETGDHTIEGEWKKNIRTVGRVHVKSGAVVRDATIIATDIIVGGDCAQATLKPTRRVELDTGALLPPGLLDEHCVLVRAGARLSLDTPLRCSDLDIHGELQASAAPTGMVTIHAGGMFRGDLKAAHLTVHDGGGLSAKLHIQPEEPEIQDGERKSVVGSRMSEGRSRMSEDGMSAVGLAMAGVQRAENAGKTDNSEKQAAKPSPPEPKPTAKRVSSTKRKKRSSKRPPGKVE